MDRANVWLLVGISSLAVGLLLWRRGSSRSCTTREVPARPSENGADKKLPAHAVVRKPTLQSSTGLTAEALIAWIDTLTKTDTFAIPTLLDWVEQLATEEKHVEHLARCLTVLQQLIAPGHELAARAVEAGVKASHLELDRSLELLIVILKGSRRHSGPPATVGVVDLAMRTSQGALDGVVSRTAYQRCCRLLHFIAQGTLSKDLLIAAGGHDMILELMRVFEDDPGVMLEGCSCLLCLVPNSSLDAEKAAELMIRCLQKFPTNGEVQWRALVTLHGLRGWEAFRSAEVARLAMAAFEQHPRSFDVVVEWVAKVLCRLAPRALKTAESKWLKRFKDAPHNLRKSNKQAELSVTELFRKIGS
mmetsp:Transcript_62262/g.129206  ORF Transcript_62262/g.129206 Transcript_62262/m.129206 type:complete len:361 (-) Transcript_62262:8-1090(-)